MRQRISSGAPMEPTIGYSRAIRVGNQVWVSATAAIWPDGHVDPDAAAQADRCLEIIEAALSEAGATLRDVVRTRIYLADAADCEAVSRVHGRYFGAIRPANSLVEVSALIGDYKVEIEAEALLD